MYNIRHWGMYAPVFFVSIIYKPSIYVTKEKARR